jgi:predicted RND superfamily exporter protein
MKVELTKQECEKIVTGEIALTTVMAICAIAIVAVVVYRMFLSKSGNTSIPGGWKFTWN